MISKFYLLQDPEKCLNSLDMQIYHTSFEELQAIFQLQMLTHCKQVLYKADELEFCLQFLYALTMKPILEQKRNEYVCFTVGNA